MSTGTPSPTAAWPCWWRLARPWPRALPADLAERWKAQGEAGLFFGTHAEACAASAAEPVRPAAADALDQLGLFTTEAA